MKLPKAIAIETLVKKSLPSDITLGEARAFLMNTREMQTLKAYSQFNRIRTRFLDNQGDELPDTMTMRELRKAIEAKTARIVIDDGEGGMRVREGV